MRVCACVCVFEKNKASILYSETSILNLLWTTFYRFHVFSEKRKKEGWCIFVNNHESAIVIYVLEGKFTTVFDFIKNVIANCTKLFLNFKYAELD